MPFAHATCVVARSETREHGRWLREFWLTAGHGDWVEVDFERRDGPRTVPYQLPRLFITRGPLGELLGQEFLDGYGEHEKLLGLQGDLDALRAGSDERRWTPERRGAIATAQGALEDAFYAAPCPLDVTVVALSHDSLDALRDDFEALNLPRGRFVDATPDVAPPQSVAPDKQLSL